MNSKGYTMKNIQPIKRKAGELDNLTPEARKFIEELDEAVNEVIRKSDAGDVLIFDTIEEAHQWLFKNPNTDKVIGVG